LARAAQEAGQRVDPPDEECTSEYDRGVGQAGCEGWSVAAHSAVERGATKKHDAAEGKGHAARQDEAVRDQGVGLITPAGAEGAGSARASGGVVGYRPRPGRPRQ